ncbi:DNA-binding NtrC family response regulator [Thiogranum longum]|uniref:DNA-binding NtrC family response regulator n=1 Tax=Thiogranum longum TaxID=1537524 RepID=A0A4R1H6L0_9GAMM|nr:sigma-54 dependent transcriptional regulator [Thiogranum longum]TCK16788.1 DNA-binding NtrC family response regulator [Thiogranum longum]
MSSGHILVVDDEPDIRNLVKEILEDEGFEVSIAESGEAARQARRKRRPDLILLDIWMDDVDGITLLREWSEGSGLPCPVVIMSGHGTVETAVEATRLGAYDFIEKPISLAKLLLVVNRALESEKLQQENQGLKRQALPVAEPAGKSDVMQSLRQQAQRIAQHNTWVLVSGEPGSGKEVVARYIHAHSNLRDQPFVEVAVGSMSPEHSAAELFGSEEGNNITYGRLEQANSGTLLLGNISDMDMQTQSRLLSVFQTHSFLRMGGTEPVPVDIRVIATTSDDLEEAVKAGRFREDLYYHLNVVPLTVPPLREHSEDVPELLNYYVDRFVVQENLPYREFSIAAQNRLRNYGWPGNIRELKNLVQRLLILGQGPVIEVEEVEGALQHERTPASSDEGGADLPLDLPLREAREQFEKVYLEHQLQEVGGSVGKLAKRVGMERTHLYRKLRGLGIDFKKGGD